MIFPFPNPPLWLEKGVENMKIWLKLFGINYRVWMSETCIGAKSASGDEQRRKKNFSLNLRIASV